MNTDNQKNTEQAQPINAKPSKVRYKLDDLLAQCNPNTPAPKDSIPWDVMGSVGYEAL